jgi:hypothetical protein
VVWCEDSLLVYCAFQLAEGWVREIVKQRLTLTHFVRGDWLAAGRERVLGLHQATANFDTMVLVTLP